MGIGQGQAVLPRRNTSLARTYRSNHHRRRSPARRLPLEDYIHDRSSTQTLAQTFAVQLPLAGLVSLKTALEKDDPRLLQAQTISPPPLQCVEEWPVEGACALAWAAASGAPSSYRVGDLEMLFAEVCWTASTTAGDPAAVRYFLNWYDECDRQEMRRELLAEVQLALNNRAAERPAA